MKKPLKYIRVEQIKKLVYISRLTKNLGNFFPEGFIKELPQDFFLFLLGIKNSFKIEEESNQINLILLILLLRLTGGLEINLKFESDYLFLVNEERNIGNYDFPSVKEIFLKEISNSSPEQNNSDLKTIVILTCNRPVILYETIKEYIRNFRIFGHKIKIIVSDDSDEENSEINSNLIKDIQKVYHDIVHIDKKMKQLLIKDLTQRAIKKFPLINQERFRYYIPYTFGGEGFDSSYGRNRNFVSFYMKGNSFVMVDDDSRPVVLSYETNVIREAIREMISGDTKELSEVEGYINEKEKTCFYDVDFMGYFKTSEINLPQYVKYSGAIDMETFYTKIKQQGINLSDLNIINKNRLSSGVFLYGEKDREKAGVKGLCCYFPQNTENLRVTLPENYRLEDIILGVNYYLAYNKCPVETNFALFHNKDLNPNIEIRYIHQEIRGRTIYHEFLFLSEGIPRNNFVFNLYNILQNQKHLNKDKLQELVRYKRYIFEIFKRALQVGLRDNNETIIRNLVEIIEDLKSELFGLPDEEYITFTENLILNVFRDLSSSMLLWETLKEIKFNH